MSITQLSFNAESLAAGRNASVAPRQIQGIGAAGPDATVGLPDAGLLARMSSLQGPGVPHCAASGVITVQNATMSGAGILMGDWVIVERSQVAQHGQIVVALIDEQFVVARLFRFNGQLELRSEPVGRAPARMATNVQPFIWGVVIASVRAYAPAPAAPTPA